MDDFISRQAAIDRLNSIRPVSTEGEYVHGIDVGLAMARVAIKEQPSAQQWISCSERLPKDTDPVNITWVNHKPESYYANIKDKPFTATGCYCDGKWYWYSVTCQDYLDEYRYCSVDAMDEEIEVIAWMPLPEPWKGDINEQQDN